jgi:hypothetical protein
MPQPRRPSGKERVMRKKPVKMPITFGAPTPGVAQSK